MSSNEVFRRGARISLPVPAGTPSGGPVLVGGIVAVTETVPANSASGVFGGGNADGYASCVLEGAYNLSVAGPATNQIGAPVYIKPDNTLTTDSTVSGAVLFGFVLATKAAATSVIPVLLHRC